MEFLEFNIGIETAFEPLVTPSLLHTNVIANCWVYRANVVNLDGLPLEHTFADFYKQTEKYIQTKGTPHLKSPKFELIFVCRGCTYTMLSVSLSRQSVSICLYVHTVLTQISIQFKISKKICLHSPFLYVNTQVHRFYTDDIYNDLNTIYFPNTSSTHICMSARCRVLVLSRLT